MRPKKIREVARREAQREKKELKRLIGIYGSQPPDCCYCGGKPVLHENPQETLAKYVKGGPLWACVNHSHCNARVGCHPGTTIPLGTMANRRLRRSRLELHDLFDKLWFRGYKSQSGYVRLRNLLYDEMAEHMGIPTRQCHIGMFSLQQCESALVFVKYKLQQRFHEQAGMQNG